MTKSPEYIRGFCYAHGHSEEDLKNCSLNLALMPFGFAVIADAD